MNELEVKPPEPGQDIIIFTQQDSVTSGEYVGSCFMFEQYFIVVSQSSSKNVFVPVNTISRIDVNV